MRFLKNCIFSIIFITFFLCFCYACARIGTPSGGVYDYSPPHYVSSIPEPNAKNYNHNKIEITFDELISIEKPMEKVIITPPQVKAPEIKTNGKKIIVELKDSLLPNTTYTFDFTNGIVDNNEKNVLENFSFAFSTGETVDSMVVGGVLLNAENLEPMPNIMVGLHSNLNDTAFTSIPFARTTKTNDRGQFWVRNVSPGSYHVFALNDLNRDYHFDQSGEDIAFIDSVFVPSFVPAIRFDTIWADSVTVDTIKEIAYNRFIPDDIKLLLFKEPFERQYLSRPERTEHSLIFKFNSAKDLAPTFNLLNMGEGSEEWAIPEYGEDGKTLTLWIKDSLIYNADTLLLDVDYLKSDSLNQLVQTKDTFSLVLRKQAAKKKNKKESEKIEFLGVNFSTQSPMDVFDTVKIVFSEPLLELDLKKIRIEQKVDTLWELREFPIVQDSLNSRMYYVKQKWPYEGEYRISIDSASINSIYGKWNDKSEAVFKFRKNTDYGHLYVEVSGNESNGFGELLDTGDKVVRRSGINNGELIFINLKPGKYYLRYIEDVNENKKWDPGVYAEKRLPETVYYYPTLFDIKQNFEFEQPWDVKAVPLEKQKPLEITKNKPAEKKIKRNENTNHQNDSQQNMGGTTRSSQTTQGLR